MGIGGILWADEPFVLLSGTGQVPVDSGTERVAEDLMGLRGDPRRALLSLPGSGVEFIAYQTPESGASEHGEVR